MLLDRVPSPVRVHSCEATLASVSRSKLDSVDAVIVPSTLIRGCGTTQKLIDHVMRCLIRLLLAFVHCECPAASQGNHPACQGWQNPSSSSTQTLKYHQRNAPWVAVIVARGLVLCSPLQATGRASEHSLHNVCGWASLENLAQVLSCRFRHVNVFSRLCKAKYGSRVPKADGNLNCIHVRLFWHVMCHRRASVQSHQRTEIRCGAVTTGTQEYPKRWIKCSTGDVPTQSQNASPSSPWRARNCRDLCVWKQRSIGRPQPRPHASDERHIHERLRSQSCVPAQVCNHIHTSPSNCHGYANPLRAL